MEGIQKPCPAGTYGSIYGLTNTNCSDICDAGHYCPEGSIHPTKCSSTHPLTYYCPKGHFQPRLVPLGHYSNEYQNETILAPKGYYANNANHKEDDGLLFPCPSGTYGDVEGLFDSSCSGVCEEGWYCPPESTSAHEIFCGNSSVYCPKQSSNPLRVQSGYYTTTVDEECPPGHYRTISNNTSTILDHNISITISSCTPCEDGTYKYQSGNDKHMCRACPGAAQHTKDKIMCQCYDSNQNQVHNHSVVRKHFNVETGKCEYVQTELNIQSYIISYIQSTPLTKTQEFPCEIGYFCINGIRYPCPPGTYGDKKLETRPTCSGLCSAGYWCGSASTKPTQHKCGGTNAYCPMGSSVPSYVTKGHFTNEHKHPMTRDLQSMCPPGYYCVGGIRIECPAGRFGASSGLHHSECDGLCSEGYYCPSASTSQTQERCGNSTVHCPEGSALPLITPPGYYSTISKYKWEIDHIKLNHDNSTLAAAKVCEMGYWCLHGKKFQCPEGTYGEVIGSSTEDDCKPCKPGYYCPSYPGPPSTIPTTFECGDQKYCPEKSSKPLYIDVGYYGVGGINAHVRIDQEICPRGHYCDNGMKFLCPEGSYGNSTGIFERRCTGFCPAGFYCPEGSIEPLECPPNTFATPGSFSCTKCDPSQNNQERTRCRTSRICCSQ